MRFFRLPSMLKFVLFGALCFWGPDIAIRAWTKQSPSVSTLNVLLPCSLVCGYLITFLGAKSGRCPSAAVYMLLGVWVLGLFAMGVGSTFLGAGFHESPIVSILGTLLLGLVPIYTFIGATYAGSLYALLIVSLMMPLLHLTFERSHWIVPPEGMKYFRRKK
jgi:hypothetical protein